MLERFPAGTLIPVAVDDTTAEHQGAKVYGKGGHRDAVRSSHTHTSYRWGHKWVVLAIVVKFPWARCPWSLPILAAFYRPERLDAAEGRRHKTPAQLARQLFATLIHWFPEQTFTLLGDGGYATTDLAHFCARHGRHLVSRIRDDAGLYASPPARRRGAKGPPRRLAAASRDGVVREKGPDVQRRQRHDPSAVVARNDFRNLAV